MKAIEKYDLGVSKAVKKDNSIYYRASFTYRGKHISLGSYLTKKKAHQAYVEASSLITAPITIEDYNNSYTISFDSFISIINFRDNNIYTKNPIYIRKNYFSYFYCPTLEFKFDVDDLFFYSHHKIMKRNMHLFVSEYGMQTNILSRYGIRNHAVIGKDYIFVNGDTSDFRYTNIKVINKYYGVFDISSSGRTRYEVKIHLNGYVIVGRYNKEIDAAIAYNKAVDFLKEHKYKKNFYYNYIDELTPIQYAARYSQIRITPYLIDYC